MHVFLQILRGKIQTSLEYTVMQYFYSNLFQKVFLRLSIGFSFEFNNWNNCSLSVFLLTASKLQCIELKLFSSVLNVMFPSLLLMERPCPNFHTVFWVTWNAEDCMLFLYFWVYFSTVTSMVPLLVSANRMSGKPKG